MSRIKTFFSLLDKPGKMMLTIAGKGHFKWMSDEQYIKIVYRLIFGKKLSLDNPQTFNEKIQWLKLYHRKAEYSKMVDKYEVKQYISEKIGSEYVIPTLGVWEKVEDIDIHDLPDQFVLKCTHDSGSVVICKNKNTFDFEQAKHRLKSHLKNSTFWYGREWPYTKVVPRIIAEQYLEDESKQLKDYKFMCFNGEAKCCFVFSDRYSETGVRLNVFNKNWEPLPVGREYTTLNPNIQKPKNLPVMIEIAEKIANGIPFVRIDFYEVKERLYFGEITFYPNSGFTTFKPEEWDKRFGDWITLPNMQLDNKTTVRQ